MTAVKFITRLVLRGMKILGKFHSVNNATFVTGMPLSLVHEFDLVKTRFRVKNSLGISSRHSEEISHSLTTSRKIQPGTVILGSSEVDTFAYSG